MLGGPLFHFVLGGLAFSVVLGCPLVPFVLVGSFVSIILGGPFFLLCSVFLCLRCVWWSFVYVVLGGP